MYDSENLGSDDESENRTDMAHGDIVDIVQNRRGKIQLLWWRLKRNCSIIR